MSRAYEYGVLMKPKVLIAMLALYASSYLGSYGSSGGGCLDFNHFLQGFVAVFTAVSGANALNCYLDRDIDALMARTWGRPLARGTITLEGAFAFSTTLLAGAALISLNMGPIPFLLFIIGAGCYLALYTFLLKRRTSLNVLATAPSVAAPVWFGWYIGGAPLYPVGLFMGLLVAIWGLLHLWSLAYVYSKDYLRVDVPMLTVVTTDEKAVRYILTTLGLIVSSSFFLGSWSSWFYTICVSLMNVPLLMAGFRFYKSKSKRAGLWLFKLSAPYIVVVLLSFTLDRVIFA